MNRVITIGREFGSGGRELGGRLAHELGYVFYDKEIITAIVNDTDLAEGYVKEVLDGKNRSFFTFTINQTMNVNMDYQIQQMQTIIKAQTEVIKEMALKSDCVIVGRCADYILKDLRDAGEIELFRMFIYADPESRLKRCQERASEAEKNLSEKEMIRRIRKVNRERASYYEDYTLQKWGEKSNYDICLNTSFMVIEDMVPHIAKLFER